MVIRRAAAAAFAAFVAGGVLVAASAHAADSADECVAVQRTEQSNGLQFDVKNNCDRRLSCSLTWRLSCENASGKVTSSAQKATSFGVAASSEHQVFGSATACKDAWRIDDVSWDCAPTQK